MEYVRELFLMLVMFCLSFCSAYCMQPQNFEYKALPALKFCILCEPVSCLQDCINKYQEGLIPLFEQVNSKDLKIHMIDKHQGGKGPSCYQKFSIDNARKVVAYDQQVLHVCASCNLHYTNYKDYFVHVLSVHHSEKNYVPEDVLKTKQCSLCGIIYKNQESLKGHLLAVVHADKNDNLIAPLAVLSQRKQLIGHQAPAVVQCQPSIASEKGKVSFILGQTADDVDLDAIMKAFGTKN